MQAQAGDFMRALFELGWFDDVDRAVEASGNELAQLLWLRASVFERHHPMVSMIAAMIQKSEADLDALFEKTREYQ